MNLIPKICELLGVEIGEEFNAEHANIGKVLTNSKDEPVIFKFQNDGLYAKCSYGSGDFFLIGMGNFLKGDYEIVKLPFEPKDGETYYTVRFYANELVVCDREFRYEMTPLADKYCGNCFRTKAEAEREKYNVYERLTGKKWEE